MATKAERFKSRMQRSGAKPAKKSPPEPTEPPADRTSDTKEDSTRPMARKTPARDKDASNVTRRQTRRTATPQARAAKAGVRKRA